MSNRINAHKGYSRILKEASARGALWQTKRLLCQRDLFFLLVYVLHRQDVNHDWLFDRCREVAANPDNMLDLWARAHYKSTIISFASSIQDILNNPDITIGIFSFTRPIAKAFLRQIKTEFEINDELKELFPDIFYVDPKKEAPKWSEDDGIQVKRKLNTKESTVEAWGLVDGMPTSRHFALRIYDDVVTDTSVTTPDMIRKVTRAWELSQNLATLKGGKVRVCGTRYHFADTYHVMLHRGSLVAREYPATVDGTERGTPVLLTQQALDTKRRDMGMYTFATQMLLKPVTEEMQELRPEWLKYWPAIDFSNLNIYLLCDPAGSKKAGSDYTVFCVCGVGADNNYYILEWVRGRLNLVERADALFDLHRRYHPLKVGYEKYGMQSDREHFEDRMNRENYRFKIIDLGGMTLSKQDRIRRLVPLFEAERIYLPEIAGGKDNTKIFVNDEYLLFPYSAHDDMLDCLARVLDIKPVCPRLNAPKRSRIFASVPQDIVVGY